MTKPTLLLVTAAGLLAAILAASWLPTHPATAAAVAYTLAVGTLAHTIGAPPARTVGASVLVITSVLILVLRTVRKITDVALWILTTASQGALNTAKAFA